MTDEEYIRAKHDLKYQLRDEQNDKCYYCGVNFSPETPSTIDHKTPRTDGGKNEKDNLVAACRQCNYLKSDMSENDFKLILLLRKYDDKHKSFQPEPIQYKLWGELPTKSFNPKLTLQIFEKLHASMRVFDDKSIVERIILDLINECVDSKIVSRDAMKKFLPFKESQYDV